MARAQVRNWPVVGLQVTHKPWLPTCMQMGESNRIRRIKADKNQPKSAASVKIHVHFHRYWCRVSGPDEQSESRVWCMSAILELRNVTKVFGGGAFHKQQTIALDDVTFSIPAERPTMSSVAAGESGSGKTTLSRLLLCGGDRSKLRPNFVQWR